MYMYMHMHMHMCMHMYMFGDKLESNPTTPKKNTPSLR